MKHTHSKNSLFLMEILLNILLFSVLLVVSLQFFSRTHKLTKETAQLHQAVSSCTNVASIFSSGDGTTADILAVYPYSVKLNDNVMIYLDKNFNDCKKKQAQYYITAKLSDDSTDQFSKLIIQCRTMDRNLIYELSTCHYNQLYAQPGLKHKGVD